VRIDFLIDSDFLVSRWKDGKASPAERWLENHQFAGLAISWLGSGEFLRVATKAGLAGKEVNAFLQRFPVVLADSEICTRYAQLSADHLSSRDQWLAAVAMKLGVPLVTNNPALSENIPGLRIERF